MYEEAESGEQNQQHAAITYFQTNIKIINMNHNPELRIKELGIELPPAPKPMGVYKPVLITGNFLYVSGQGPLKADGTLIKGRVGDDLTMEQGKEAARQVGLAMLSLVKNNLGDLGRIKRLVKTLGMVNSSPDFTMHPAVINGFSELMAEVFGEDNGIGVRSAVGMFLPNNIAVEIEAMFELKD
jgi:enamine deaminase RidA (YjgF/YER057c/UK114 family)